MTQRERVHRYLTTYEHVRRTAGWSADKQTSMLVASQFIGHEERFDAAELKRIAEYLKNRAGFFSYMRSPLRFPIAGLLLAGSTEPETDAAQVENNYERIVAQGFNRSVFTHIAACALTLSVEGEPADELVRRAKKIHEGMRRHHFFLTGQDDVPLAVLLAGEDGEIEALIEEIEFYYNAMEGFMRIGNDRQYLSHVLTYGHTDRRQDLADLTIHWLDVLRRRGIRIRSMHYPVIGILSLLGPPEKLLEDVVYAYKLLEQERAFRRSGGMSFLLAVRLAVQDRLESDTLIGVSMTATVEAILQAQQAAAIAATSNVAGGNSSSATAAE